MEFLTANLTETGLMLAGFVLHVVGKAREIDRSTPEREPFLSIIANTLWGDDSRWGTLFVVGVICLVGLTGSATQVLTSQGVTVAETGGKVMVFGGAGYAMESMAPKLLALVSKKVAE